MRSKSQIIDYLSAAGIIAVVRARSREQVIPLAEALLQGGIKVIEITMTTPDAIPAIAEATRHFAESALIGVGTILDAANCSAALDAGAEFVVTPVVRPAFVGLAHVKGRPIMLGAWTPTEAQNAFEAGADFIKVFPAGLLGPTFIRELRAPLPHLKIVPTGGVDLTNIAEFFKVGCCAVGLATALITKEILEKNDWAELTKRAKTFVSAAAAAMPHPGHALK